MRAPRANARIWWVGTDWTSGRAAGPHPDYVAGGTRGLAFAAEQTRNARGTGWISMPGAVHAFDRLESHGHQGRRGALRQARYTRPCPRGRLLQVSPDDLAQRAEDLAASLIAPLGQRWVHVQRVARRA